MAFEDTSRPGTTRPLGISTGEFQAVRHESSTFEHVPALVAGSSAAGSPAPPTATQPNLHYVFDDPNDGEPGRDRMLVHGLWEVLLALAIAGTGIALSRAKPGALGGDGLRDLLLSATVLALLAIASAFALRAAVPNLAVGGAALVAGLWVAHHANGAWLVPAVAAMGICVIGLVQGRFVVLLHVPAWAAGLGVAMALGVWFTNQSSATAHVAYEPRPDAYLWFVGVCAISIVLSLVGVPSRVRRGFGRFRPVADPARRRGRGAEVVAVLATMGSMVLAGLAGAFGVLVRPHMEIAPGDGLQLTALSLAAALFGRTSAFGRRGEHLEPVLADHLGPAEAREV